MEIMVFFCWTRFGSRVPRHVISRSFVVRAPRRLFLSVYYVALLAVSAWQFCHALARRRQALYFPGFALLSARGLAGGQQGGRKVVPSRWSPHLSRAACFRFFAKGVPIASLVWRRFAR